MVFSSNKGKSQIYLLVYKLTRNSTKRAEFQNFRKDKLFLWCVDRHYCKFPSAVKKGLLLCYINKKDRHKACLLARQEGFEPPTLWFVARYSIQLSYWRTSQHQYILSYQRWNVKCFFEIYLFYMLVCQWCVTKKSEKFAI